MDFHGSGSLSAPGAQTAGTNPSSDPEFQEHPLRAERYAFITAAAIENILHDRRVKPAFSTAFDDSDERKANDDGQSDEGHRFDVVGESKEGSERARQLEHVRPPTLDVPNKNVAHPCCLHGVTQPVRPAPGRNTHRVQNREATRDGMYRTNRL
jgi:hypothetical protein